MPSSGPEASHTARDHPRTGRPPGAAAHLSSNREIGQLLCISTKTGSVHVSDILAELRAAGRTEAVAVARRRGLL